MTKLREQIAQMIVVGCRGEALTREERLIFADCQFGGFILFGNNCTAPGQIVQLCRSLWESAVDMPPFIAIDQEGGKVHRLPKPFTHFPAAASIGEQRNPDLAYGLGRAAAEELKLVGINLDFAPVLDVNSAATNPIIDDRAFGSDPASVIEIGTAWARGLKEGGIIPCGKHFPGHGHGDKDSHLDLPTVEKSLDELRATELPPFVHACRSGIDALMTAHVRYPALDPGLPATLSEPIITGLLRHELGFDGVVFSDDLEMKAISDHRTPAEAASLAVRAGVDMLLFCHGLERAVDAFEFLCAAGERDATIRARVENSFRRITALKQRYLKVFSGAAVREIEARLIELGQQRRSARAYGNL